jgi:hypothetical protein
MNENMIYGDHGHFPRPKHVDHDHPPLSKEDEHQIVTHFLPALPDNHWAKKLYQEVLRLREKRQVKEVIEGVLTVDEASGTLSFEIKPRT